MAAEVSPLTRKPSLRITPAPKKPSPVAEEIAKKFIQQSPTALRLQKEIIN